MCDHTYNGGSPRYYNTVNPSYYHHIFALALQPKDHTRFPIHLLLPSAVHRIQPVFLARRIQPFLSLVDREVEFCVTNNRSPLVGHFYLFIFFYFSEEKYPLPGFELTSSQRVRRLVTRFPTELPGGATITNYNNNNSRDWINRVRRLPILLVVVMFPCPRSRLRIWSRETGSAVPFRVTLLHKYIMSFSSQHSLIMNLVLTYGGIPPDFRGGGGVHFFIPPCTIGSVPSLSGRAIAYRWRSPRVRRPGSSSSQGSTSNGCLPFQVSPWWPK